MVVYSSASPLPVDSESGTHGGNDDDGDVEADVLLATARRLA